MTPPDTSINRAERLWRWLRGVCEAEIKAAYMERTGWDLKCPHCQSWASIAGIELQSWNDEQSRYLCQQCLVITAWHFDGPVAWPVPMSYFGREAS